MFCYAVGKKIAQKYRAPLFLDRIEFFTSKYLFNKGLSTREFQLYNFSGPSECKCWPWISSLGFFVLSVLGQVVGRTRHIQLLNRLGIHFHISSDPFHPNPRQNTEDLPVIYSSWLIFSTDYMPSRERLVEEFKLRNPLPSETQSALRDILASESVSVHIRRSDYLTQKTSWCLPFDYYPQAFATIRKKVPNPRWFVFSDDPNWCREKFAAMENVTIIEGNGNRPWIDLHLMRNCRHHVIANSTFSWWGAYLRRDTTGIVTCPSNWGPAAPNPLPNTFIPAEWIKIDNDFHPSRETNEQRPTSWSSQRSHIHDSNRNSR